MKKKFKFEIFSMKINPARHIKYKTIDFFTSNKLTMATKLFSTI